MLQEYDQKYLYSHRGWANQDTEETFYDTTGAHYPGHPDREEVRSLGAIEGALAGTEEGL